MEKIKEDRLDDNGLEPSTAAFTRYVEGIVDNISDLRDLRIESIKENELDANGLKPSTAAFIRYVEGIVDNISDLRDLRNKIKKAGVFCYDLETTSKNALDAELVGIAISTDGVDGYYIPLTHSQGGNFEIGNSFNLNEEIANPEIGVVLGIIGDLFENEEIVKIAHNSKYDNTVMRRYGVHVKNTWDTIAAAFILFGGYPRHEEEGKVGLKSLVKRLLGYEMKTYKETAGDLNFRDVEVALAAPYAIDDAIYTFKLKETLEEGLEEEKNHPKHPLKDGVFEAEQGVTECMIDALIHGMIVDVPYLEKLLKKYAFQIKINAQLIASLSKGKIKNPNSTPQVGAFLCGYLKLEPKGFTATGKPKVDLGSLEHMKTQTDDPIIDAILAVKKAVKMRGFVVSLLEKQVNGRIHANFNQFVTVTGRFSSSNPNLQQLPSYGIGAEIRGAFIAPEGMAMFAADYSQQEVRIAAHVSKDPYLVKAYENNEDVHTIIARIVFNTEEPTSEQRKSGKVVTFGLIYGKTAYSLRHDLGMSLEEAERFIENYFARMQGIKRMIGSIQAFIKINDYSPSIAGTKRHFKDVKFMDEYDQSKVYRQGVNNVIQSSAAWQMRKAIADMNDPVKKLGAIVTAQVHDEVLGYALKGTEKRVEHAIEEAMVHAYEFNVPMAVDTDWGSNWYELKHGKPRPEIADFDITIEEALQVEAKNYCIVA